MRAWTIVLFILCIHMMLAAFTWAGVGNGILGYTLDTSGHQASFNPIPGNYTVQLPITSQFFNGSANGTQITNNSLIKSGGVVGEWIENIIGVGSYFTNLINTFKDAVFSIHYLTAPYFGDVLGWLLEGIVDLVLGISFFQMVTGRSFKTME